ncbi:MAG: endonuclease domain-containing protein [Bacteroidetes bacterium]|nr:endonuclease domain-containing protein [Bacteroidota bacterium]
MKIYYNQKLKQYSRDLRNNSTLSEVLLWKQLKGRKMKGYQFMRQKPIEKYIVDFYCSKLKLAIEVDGSSHNEKAEKDLKRQTELEKLGIIFLRLDDNLIKTQIHHIIRVIEDFIEELEKQNQLQTTP